eukprot:TRINITY_DN274_c0_g2_i2.p1 TRINITY_DN274_c0_g2~~TRINITY_DN274_c0_g2_i2.p1  ORF type:complete len:448 (-),score=96.80 TRINITY_DN274_c0_g2_i2:169-1512(-)
MLFRGRLPLPPPLKSAAVGGRPYHLHEIDCYQVLAKYGVRTPTCGAAYSATDAKAVAEELGIRPMIVKAQILAGGRRRGVFDSGFQGGVHVVPSPERVAEVTSKMIGHRLFTKQTGRHGRPVLKVMVAEPVSIAQEYYFALTLDRRAGGVVMLGCRMTSNSGNNNSSSSGSITEVQQKNPSAIKKQVIDLNGGGLTFQQCNWMAKELGLTPALAAQAIDQFQRLFAAMLGSDATTVEVSPMVETQDGDLVCVDVKMTFDDNSDFRQAELMSMRDVTQEDPREVEAQRYGFSYVGLSGSIGVMVNGAGLAMATMDLLKLYSGAPANFLDVGGSEDEETITRAFELMANDPRVRAVFVNIFGGITNCRTIAKGVLSALNRVDIRVPIVVRLLGNEMDEAETLLANYSGPNSVISITDFDNAAKTVAFIAAHWRQTPLSPEDNHQHHHNH